MTVSLVAHDTQLRYQRSLSTPEIPGFFKQVKGKYDKPPRLLTSSLNAFFSLLCDAFAAVDGGEANDGSTYLTTVTQADRRRAVVAIECARGGSGCEEGTLGLHIALPVREDTGNNKWAGSRAHGSGSIGSSVASPVMGAVGCDHPSSRATMSPSTPVSANGRLHASTFSPPNSATSLNENSGTLASPLSSPLSRSSAKFPLSPGVRSLLSPSVPTGSSVPTGRLPTGRLLSPPSSSSLPPSTLERFLRFSPVEQLLEVGTPVYSAHLLSPPPPSSPHANGNQAIATRSHSPSHEDSSNNDRNDVKDTDNTSPDVIDSHPSACSHGIIIDVRRDGPFPYYMVLRQLQDKKGDSPPNSNTESGDSSNSTEDLQCGRSELVPVLHRELVGQQHFLSCGCTPELYHATVASTGARLNGNNASPANVPLPPQPPQWCQICTGQELHPVIAADLLPTRAESDLLLELPPMDCMCKRPLLQRPSIAARRSAAAALQPGQGTAPLLQPSTSGTTNEVTAGSLGLLVSSVRMTSPLLGATQRLPCCSLECALQFSRGK